MKPGSLIRRAAMKRSNKPVKARSDRREAAKPHEDEVRAFVEQRDERCVYHAASCPLYLGFPTVHHLRKQAQGGPWSRENCVVLCAWANRQLESDADFAELGHELGLVVLAGETVESAWERMRAAGLVTYDPNGDPA